MKYLDSKTLDIIKQDQDNREALIRRHVYEAMEELDPPDLSESIVASYFVWAHTLTPNQVGQEICYHMTSGVRSSQAGSLLDQCTGKVVDWVCFDKEQRCGLVRVAFPLKMLRDEQGNLYSTHILHITAGAGVFALTENIDMKLVRLDMSEEVLRSFPGPAYGAAGVRQLTGFGADEIALGTILKPCTGITPAEEVAIVKELAANPIFLFIKEDENFLPDVTFAPLRERMKLVRETIKDLSHQRDDKGLIFAPHITSPPHLLAEHIKMVLEVGCDGIMFSESYSGGAVRLGRELTRGMTKPPAIYGHNGGISTRTRHIYREVLDLLARLDGTDFRQTAPLTEGRSLLRPAGLEWRNCERVLSQPMAGHAPVMMARAGGLDQGNIIANLVDVSAGAGVKNYLFLAGSAISSIKNENGHYDPVVGAEAMKQALLVFREGVFTDPDEASPSCLKSYADSYGLKELSLALSQRYVL